MATDTDSLASEAPAEIVGFDKASHDANNSEGVPSFTKQLESSLHNPAKLPTQQTDKVSTTATATDPLAPKAPAASDGFDALQAAINSKGAVVPSQLEPDKPKPSNDPKDPYDSATSLDAAQDEPGDNMFGFFVTLSSSSLFSLVPASLCLPPSSVSSPVDPAGSHYHPQDKTAASINYAPGTPDSRNGWWCVYTSRREWTLWMQTRKPYRSLGRRGLWLHTYSSWWEWRKWRCRSHRGSGTSST